MVTVNHVIITRENQQNKIITKQIYFDGSCSVCHNHSIYLSMLLWSS